MLIGYLKDKFLKDTPFYAKIEVKVSFPKNTDMRDTDTQNSAYPVYGCG